MEWLMRKDAKLNYFISTEIATFSDIRENQIGRLIPLHDTRVKSEIIVKDPLSQKVYRLTRRAIPNASKRFWKFCITYKHLFPKWIKIMGKKIVWQSSTQVGVSDFIFPENLSLGLDTHLVQYFYGFGIETSEEPEISIIIPVHNNIAFTIALLSRLRYNRESVTFEIIVVDDASNDSTSNVLSKIRGLKILTLQENVGYLAATNEGIKRAKGNYICLLNNDTLPETGWLTSLYETMMNDSTIAVAGSMLIDSSGNILEAGSQIFQNKTIWNLGRGNSRFNPMYLFNREVDYCSAAAILVRSEFIEISKGFDPQFKPAYYEDTDLCLQAWSLGRRVVFVHDSVVFHQEGGSHGTDLNKGIKKYQLVNKEKFWAKWENQFRSDWEFNEQQRIEYLRNSKGIIVFCDDGISDPSRASGARRAFNIINSIQALGYHVILIPVTPLVSHELLNRYRSAGVEVYPSYETALNNLRYRENRIKAFWISRVTVADILWQRVANDFHNYPIIFDTVDLHFLRNSRSIENSIKNKPIYQDSDLETRELAYIRAAKIAVVVSSAEQILLRNMEEGLKTHLLFDSFERESIRPEVKSKENILFVGNFAHTPNSDGLFWFIKNVLPLISQNLLRKVQIEVVGSGASDELCRLMRENNIQYHGWQESISKFYDRAKVSIAPLLFGSGVKGKIIESYAFQVPVVSTSIGLEGTGLNHMEEAICADDPIDFARGLEKLFDDQVLCTNLGVKGSVKILELFGTKAFNESLAQIINLATDDA